MHGIFMSSSLSRSLFTALLALFLPSLGSAKLPVDVQQSSFELREFALGKVSIMSGCLDSPRQAKTQTVTQNCRLQGLGQLVPATNPALGSGLSGKQPLEHWRAQMPKGPKEDIA